ncbi:MAG: hypothetical protein DSY35_03575 [Desulfurobacterium sp.]|nr:MAG: hypothetical protein DSY35_03575 [Desulfurobacterium sp.]
MKKASFYLCAVLYVASFVLAIVISAKVANIRSKCTHQKAKITKLVKEIESLKEENNRLTIRYYSILNPKTVDENSRNLRLLKENEVKYLK